MAALVSGFSACKQAVKEKSTVADPATFSADTAKVSSLLKQSADFSQVNFDSMQFYATAAHQLAVKTGFPSGIAKALSVEANYQRRLGDYSGAIETSLKAIHIYDSLQLWPELVKAKTLLSDIYKEMGGEKGTSAFQEQALTLAREAEKLAERENDMPGLINSLNMQGIILRDMSETINRPDLMDTAFQLYSRGISIIEKTGKGSENLGKLYNNISQVYNEHLKDYKKALEYQMKAIEFNTSRKNKISLTYNYNTTAEIYKNMGNTQMAEQYAHAMLELCRELKSPFRMVNAYAVLHDIHKLENRYDSALYYFKERVNLSDSLNNITKSSQIANVQVKYETGKKEEEINHLNGLNREKNQRMVVLGVASFVLLLLLAVVWNQKRKSQQQKQKISEQSDKLQWMMKELHHRVKNNLQIVSSLLNLQSYRLKDEESQSAIRESQLRVQAMSLMHQRLYQVEDVSLVNFKLYLTDLAETLMKAYGYHSDSFDLQIHIEKEMMDVDTVMPLGLLVNEIITNSFKYAYKEVARPSLHITLNDQGKQLNLEIRDNGPGIPEQQTKPGFGQKLIKALSGQLKATYAVRNDQGAVYQFTIPVQTEKAA